MALDQSFKFINLLMALYQSRKFTIWFNTYRIGCVIIMIFLIKFPKIDSYMLHDCIGHVPKPWPRHLKTWSGFLKQWGVTLTFKLFTCFIITRRLLWTRSKYTKQYPWLDHEFQMLANNQQLCFKYHLL